MLVLQRRSGEWIRLQHVNGDVIRICVTDIRRALQGPANDKARLGIEAAHSWRIMREELLGTSDETETEQCH